MYLAADSHVVTLHELIDKFAIEFQHELNTIDLGGHPHPRAYRALNSIGIDALGLHRATRHLCEGGYAFACPPTVRTLMDLTVSTGILVSDDQPHDLMAFKYTYHFAKVRLGLPTTPEPEKAQLDTEVRKAITESPESYRELVQSYIFNSRTRAYWWSPEYGRPSELVEKFIGPAFPDLYNLLSGGSHGSLLGMRFLRDNPTEQSPEPAAHPKGQNLALLTSSWLMLHIFGYRAQFEGLMPHEKLAALYGIFQAAEPFIRERPPDSPD